MRERLIELMMDVITSQNGMVSATEMADHLLANGVIVQPCKVGDTVWYELYGEIVSAVVYKAHGKLTSSGFVLTDAHAKTDNDCEVYFDHTCIGKAVFLTREAAEQALKECDGQ